MPETRRRKTSAKDWARQVDRFSERARTYRLPSIPIDKICELTTETRRQADLLFSELTSSPLFKSYKREHKRKFFQILLHTSKVAHYRGGVIRTPDRKLIAKLRRDDYTRTLRKRGQTVTKGG